MTDRAETSSDVLVIGAGVIGLSCAWRLAQRGLRVRVLERDEPGAGATGVAAGMLAPVGEATWGEEELLRAGARVALLWPEFAAELAAGGPDPGYSQLGALHVALDRDEAAELERRFELMREHGSTPSGSPRARRAGCEPSLATARRRGDQRPHEAAVDPGAPDPLAAGERERAGAEIVAGAEVVEALVEGGALAGVRDATGTEHRADRVVLAAGAGRRGVAAGGGPPAGAPGEGPGRDAARARAGLSRIVATERVYLVPRPDGRLVVGATVEEMGFDTTITAGAVHELLREAYRAVPEVAEMELVETRAGLRPGTPDNAPIVGPGAIEGLVLATGHFRNGILLAPLTAEKVARLVVGERTEAVARMTIELNGSEVEIADGATSARRSRPRR